jgi:hypothetical protein
MNQRGIDIVDAISQAQQFRVGHSVPFVRLCTNSRRNMFKRKPRPAPVKFQKRISGEIIFKQGEQASPNPFHPPAEE